ncbi:MAG: hypothetical protein REH79_03780 [Spiroplasma sp.]|nr:hypothetical protein [Spiroplasma sp.]
MKKILSFLMTLTMVSQSTLLVISCDAANPEVFGQFETISGVSGLISSVDFNNNVFYAGNKEGKIYKTNNNQKQKFEEINTKSIDYDLYDFQNLAIDNDNNLYVGTGAYKDSNNQGRLYKLNTETNQFDEQKISQKDGLFLEIIRKVFFDKRTNSLFVAVEGTVYRTRIYKLNRSNGNFDVVAEEESEFFADLNVTDDNSLYFATSTMPYEAEDSISTVYKANPNSPSEPEEVINFLEERGKIITGMADYNNVVYFSTKNLNDSNSNNIYKINNGNTNKTDIETNWEINEIIFDEEDHIYVGGSNQALYAGTIVDTNITNFKAISNQFNDIFALNYNQGIVVAGTKNAVLRAQVKDIIWDKNF